MKRVLWLAALLLLAILAGALRCWPLGDTFIEGRVYFADPDCYSRMTRARMISEGHALSIRHHDFENYPQGTTPHTTAPMDLAIAGLQRVVAALPWFKAGGASVLHAQTLDLAGALIGPLLGILACLGMGLAWPKREAGDGLRILGGVFLLAVSPIAVHGTLLGRPDHQALLITLLAFALAAEFRLAEAPSPRWGIAAGLAWGLALWVSLYEPLILLALVFAGLALGQRAAFRERARHLEWGAAAGVFLISVLLDGWRMQAPDAVLREYFARWSQSIGELRPLNWRSGLLWQWLGWAALLIPAGLAWRARQDRSARLALGLFLAVLALTLWQLRWGYFLALIAAITLPFALKALSRGWLAGLLFFVSLWPIAGAWDRQLFPDDAEQRRRFVWRREQVALRLIAEYQRDRAAGPFLAPWWLSPSIAYWSRQPGVTGSSHQSLPGIVNAAKISLAPNATEALPLLRQREVAWILADVPERIVPNAAALLGKPAPEHCLAMDLYPGGELALDTAPLILERDLPHPPGEVLFHVWRVPRDSSVPSPPAPAQ